MGGEFICDYICPKRLWFSHDLEEEVCLVKLLFGKYIIKMSFAEKVYWTLQMQ